MENYGGEFYKNDMFIPWEMPFIAIIEQDSWIIIIQFIVYF